MDGLPRRDIQLENRARESCGAQLRGNVSAANVLRDAARFFFECSGGEVRAIGPIGEIIADPLLEPAAAFALRDVDQIMQNQFPIVPGVAPNNQRVTKAHATRVFGNDAKPTRRFGQFRIFARRPIV